MLQGGSSQSISHHFWRLKYTELNEIFAFMSLRSFALSLVSIFIPIYLYVSGYGFNGLATFYLVMFTVELIFEFPVAVFIKRFGPKHLIALSTPFLLTHFMMLLTIKNYNWPLWSLAFTGGLSLALYWQSYHYDFSRAKHRKKTSIEIGKLYITVAILGVLAPFVGGLIATKFGIEWVYGAVIIILTSGIGILFKTTDTNFRPGKLNFGNIKLGEISGDMIAYGGYMIEACASLQIWPLFLFLIVRSYEKVGLVTSTALLVTIITTYYVSKNSDRNGRMQYLRSGGFLSGIVSFLKIFVVSLPQAFGINIFKSFANSIQASPFVSEYYIHADEESRSEYIYLMESANDLSKIFLYGFLLVLLLFLPEDSVIIIGLLMGAIGAFVSMLMPPAKCEICGQIENKKIKLGRRITT
jgi:MFS family permease